MSIILKYNIVKIRIYPYGGIIEYNELLNRPINYDILIALSGIFMQSIYYFIVYILYLNHIIREITFITFCNYHYSILFFNLLPIYPLDGSKILNLSINKILPFKLSHILSIIISIIIFILLLVFNYNNLNYIFISLLLLEKIIKEIKDHKYIFNKFLLERYINNFKFKKIKFIKDYKFNKMYKYHRHIFKIEGEYIPEKKVLKSRFKIDL